MVSGLDKLVYITREPGLVLPGDRKEIKEAPLSTKTLVMLKYIVTLLRIVIKLLLYSAASLIILITIGAVNQWIAEKQDLKGLPAPGKMIDVGNHQLHIQIKGKGKPVVILEAASDGSSVNWEWIINEIAKTTTVCAYDREGHGWSEFTGDPRDAFHISEELHTLLIRADIEGPLIMVGHSAGALFVKSYQQRFPETVAGMVLVDGDNEYELTELTGFNDQLESDQRFAGNMSTLANIGIPRLIFSIKEPTKDLGNLQRKQIKAFWSTSRHWKSLSQELRARQQTNKQVMEGKKVLQIPVKIISAGKQSTEWLKLQKELESLS